MGECESMPRLNEHFVGFHQWLKSHQFESRAWSKYGYGSLPDLTWQQGYLPFSPTCKVLKLTFNSALLTYNCLLTSHRMNTRLGQLCCAASQFSLWLRCYHGVTLLAFLTNLQGLQAWFQFSCLLAPHWMEGAGLGKLDRTLSCSLLHSSGCYVIVTFRKHVMAVNVISVTHGHTHKA